MPPERLPWDRKEIYSKDRKYDRSSSAPRWRDTTSFSSSRGHYGSSRDFSRWTSGGGGSNDFRRSSSGHGKQGGWHLFPDESGHGGGYVPFRSNDRILEDKNCRPSVSRDGKYGRNSNRDNRGSFGSQRDWKNHLSWDMSNGSPNTTGRIHDVVSNDQRSVEDMVTYSSSLPRPEFANTTWDQLPSKDQNDYNHNRMVGVNGLGAGHRGDSLDWKPLKWTRSGSLSSRGSGFSHSSSSKSLGGADSGEGKAELQIKNASLVQSPSGDATTACATSAPSEDMTARKKPRLNWGEGLAKYEKKKVEGPELVNVNKDGVVVISSGNPESFHSQNSNLVDKSPRVLGLSECASPATPSSGACSSPGVEEKTCSKGINAEIDVSNLCASPSMGSQSHIEALSFNLEVLDVTSIANLGSTLVELLQYDDSVDTSFVRSTLMNKLLILKGDISKALEVTESEIDSLETELKSLKFESGSRCPCPAASSSFPIQGNAKFDGEQGVTSNNFPRPSPLQVSCSDAEHVEKIPSNGVMDEVHGGTKDDDVDSPGTATSKFVEPMTIVKAVSSFDVLKPDECFGDIDAMQTSTTVLQSSMPCTKEENIDASACRDVNSLVEIKEGACFSSDVSSAEDNICSSILAANKECASRASEVFDNLLPRDLCKIDFSKVSSVTLWQNDASVKERFAIKKRFLRFKERIVTLKFKAFQHLWKEDLRLLSMRKYRAKSQKRYELSLRATHNGHQKNRSSIRSRFSSPVGNLSLVPTTEMLNFTSKMLSVSHVKACRSILKMPALILDKKEKVASKFISSNGLVEDPWAVEKERTMINPWSSEEREIFIEKLTAFGKDFQKIATFLDHKTTADCVEFYYKNHKSDCFEKTKKSKEVKSSTNYLMASSKNWNREMNAASLDILGAASVIAADADNSMGNQQMCSGRMYMAGYCDSKKLHDDDGNLDQSSNFDILENERETVAADVLAGICGSISSEAMSSCITTFVDPREGSREWKSRKVKFVKKQPSTSDVTQNIDEETCSDESCGEMDPADWTDEEKSIFVRAVSSYGKDFAMISRYVRTRSRDQCKVFFSKARKCLGLDSVHSAPGNIGTPVSDDANGGGSDTEDGCALETCSMICSDKMGSKVDEELPLHVMDTMHEESKAVKRKNLTDDFDRYESSNVSRLISLDSNVEKTFVSDVCQMECKSDLGSVYDGKVVNGFVCQSDFSQVQETSNESVSSEAEREIPVEGSVPVENSINPGPSNPVATEVKSITEGSVNGSRNQLQGKELLLPESILNSQMRDSSATRTEYHLPSDMGSSSNYCLGVENLHHVSVEFGCVENPHIVSLQQDNKLATATSVIQESSAIQCEKMHYQDRLQGVSRDDHFRQFPGKSLVNYSETQEILRGYPLQIQTKKEINGDTCRSHSEMQRISTSERIGANQFVAQDCYLQKCNRSKAECSVPELPLRPQHSEQGNDHSRDHSRSSSDSEKLCRNGDVKLFGKILSNSSASQKSTPGIHENGEQGIHCPKPGNKLSTLKFSGQQSTDGSTSVLKFDHNYLGLENVPVKSYGFWDGNKIQTGFSSIPPEYFLAKYPAAFSNYHMSASKVEQQALQAAVKCNDHNLKSVSVLPPREISGSNGVVDYQMYRSHDSGKVQPFSVEMQQRQDIFSEMQIKNGFEGISNIQQQGRGMGMVGVNVAGRGGILVGGSCSGVSDPVTAIKMHYAKSEQYAGQNGSIIKEEESWRSKGDIGR